MRPSCTGDSYQDVAPGWLRAWGQMPVLLAELSAFNAAGRQVSRLLPALVLFCLLAALAVTPPLAGAAGAMGASVGASFAATAAGFAGAACMAEARRLALRAEHLNDASGAEGLATLRGGLAHAGGSALRRANRLATWQQVAAAGGLAVLAMAAAWFAWHRGTAWDLTPNQTALGAAACLSAATAASSTSPKMKRKASETACAHGPFGSSASGGFNGMSRPLAPRRPEARRRRHETARRRCAGSGGCCRRPCRPAYRATAEASTAPGRGAGVWITAKP